MTQLLPHLSGQYADKMLSAAEEQAAARAWLERGDEAARLTIIQSHVKLVWRQARKFRFYDIEPEELVAEGMVGLVVALDKFDPEQGFRFSTYAIHWIRSMMITSIMVNSSLLRIPSSAKQKQIFFGYRKAINGIVTAARASGETLTQLDIQKKAAEALNVSLEDVLAMDTALRAVTPLDAPIAPNGDDSNSTLADNLVDEAPIPEVALARQQIDTQLKQQVSAALKTLKPREKHIIETRVMADKEDVLTLEDLGSVYNVSRERIRQIEASALRKLAKALKPEAKLLELA